MTNHEFSVLRSVLFHYSHRMLDSPYPTSSMLIARLTHHMAHIVDEMSYPEELVDLGYPTLNEFLGDLIAWDKHHRVNRSKDVLVFNSNDEYVQDMSKKMDHSKNINHIITFKDINLLVWVRSKLQALAKEEFAAVASMDAPSPRARLTRERRTRLLKDEKVKP